MCVLPYKERFKPFIMLSTTKFNSLSLDEKISLLHYHGHRLATRNYEIHQIDLYELQGTYIEVWFIPGELDIQTIKVVEEQDITPFLDQIDIDKLIVA